MRRLAAGRVNMILMTRQEERQTARQKFAEECAAPSIAPSDRLPRRGALREDAYPHLYTVRSHHRLCRRAPHEEARHVASAADLRPD
jgi:hypothetical protein